MDNARLHRSATQSGALDAGLGFADDGAGSASRVNLLTRRGNDRTAKYLAIAEADAGLPTKNAYLDGELCGAGRSEHYGGCVPMLLEMTARCREQDVEVMRLDVISSHQGFCDWIAKKVG